MELHTNKRVIVGFALSIVALFALGWYTYRNNQQVALARLAIFQTTQVLYHIEQAKSNSITLENAIAWYMLTKDSTQLQIHNDELKQATVHYTNLITLTRDNSAQQLRLDSLRKIGRRKLDLHQMLIEQRSISSFGDIAKPLLASNQEVSDKIETILNELLIEESSLLEQRIARSEIEMGRFQITFFFLIAVALIILCVVFIVVNRALHSRIEAEQKTQLVNNELEAFTYSVSHDLRAPLRSILGFSQVLNEDYNQTLGEEGNRILEKVMRNASRMGQLIDDLLDFSRIGRKELFITRINTQLQVEEAIQEITEGNTALKKYITILPLNEIQGDINMMKQVWINLISNALKYTRSTSEPAIEIGNTEIEGKVVFYIRDNGVGFDMKYYNKLFNVFQRLHNTSEFEGTGVGLALVHRIITRHNGKIWAEATPHEGAVFYFSISNHATND